MLLIKSQNITPKQRWQIYIKPLKLKKNPSYRFYFSIKHRIVNTSLSAVKYKYKTYLFYFFLKKITNIPFVVTDINYKKLPLKEFIWVKSLFNQVYILPYSELMYPGFKLYSIKYLLLLNKSFVNQLIPIFFLPINTIITYVFNTKNNFAAYAKSSGCEAIKRKNFKKQKLIYIELASGALKLFPLQTFCLLSFSKNLDLQTTVDGGWGFFKKPKKTLHVRGVAMNPVDHPNGGRTKAKQPELSPWGWIAKFNK